MWGGRGWRRREEGEIEGVAYSFSKQLGLVDPGRIPRETGHICI